MRFDRMQTTMEALVDRQEITLTDALNVFYDLCADIKDSEGIPVDKLPSGDEESAVTRLSWMGRTMLRLAKGIDTQKVEAEKSGRLSKVLGEVGQVQSELEAAEEKISMFEKQQKKLSADKKELEQRFLREAALKQECDRLEEEIKKYEEFKAPGLETRKEELSRTLKSCQDSFMEEERRLEQLKSENGRAKEKKEQLDRELELLKQQNEKVKEQLEEKEDSYRELKDRIQNSDNRRRSLTEKIETLERTLDCGDVEKLNSLYEKRKREVEDYKSRYEELREKSREKEEELERLKQESDRETKHIQELAWQEESEKKEAQTTLRELQRRIEEARSSKNELQSKVGQQEEELASLTEWFHSLEATGYEKRLEGNRGRLLAMREAQKALDEELSVICEMTVEEAKNQLIDYQKYFRDTMDKMETDMDQYLKCYYTVMKVFEKGGNGL